jgi:hypothetical protein
VAEQRLELNALEVRGLWMLRENILQAKQAVAQAESRLKAFEGQAAKDLAGRIPVGLDLTTVRIDDAKGEAWIPVKEG